MEISRCCGEEKKEEEEASKGQITYSSAYDNCEASKTTKPLHLEKLTYQGKSRSL